MLSHEVQSRPLCFLDFLTARRLGAAESTRSPRLGQQFMTKDYMCVTACGVNACLFHSPA